MAFEHSLVRLNPFEGLCLTSSDLHDEQSYHRHNLQRHSLFMHGHGIVQGLQVELRQARRRYEAIIKAGYGLTAGGQGVHLRTDHVVELPVPKQDGEYLLWLFHTEVPDPESQRPVFDTAEQREARVVENAAPRLHPAEESFNDGVALARINVRLGRMTQLQLPVPRAGRQSRAAESYLKPRVVDFIRYNKVIVTSLFRTALVKELDIAAYGFYSALVSAEFLLIEEGTSDRVLYRTAGNLAAYAHDFYSPLPPTTERVDQFKEFIRKVNAEVPGADQGDETWLAWFLGFERLLQHLQRMADELARTAEARR